MTLADDLGAIVEVLARNAHEAWATQRLAEGWRYGPARDDRLREHPCLVPYEDLPEAEKAYDRNLTLETVKALVALGYRLVPPDGGPTPDAPPGALAAEEDVDALDPTVLISLWRARHLDGAIDDVHERLGRRILQLGRPLLAHDILEDGLRRQPQSVRLRQLQALALARGGATERANAILIQLDHEAAVDEETLGLLARTHKDLGLRAADPAVRDRQLRLAFDAYLRAYRLTGGYWTGVNAASLALVLGEADVATRLAREVRTQCLAALASGREGEDERYWIVATLAEAALVVGDSTEAEDWYAKAAEAGRDRFGDLSSTRRNARLVLAHTGGDPAPIDRCLRVPRVIAFAGHMVDAPDRARARFPPALEPAVRAAIRARIEQLDGRIGFAGAACGSDILFLESIVDIGGEANVVLPYEREQYVADSVDLVPGADWKARFQHVLARASQVLTASTEKIEGSRISLDYASLLLLGLATIRAEQLDTDLVTLAVWDGLVGNAPGGTATVVADWRARGHQPEQIDLRALLRVHCPELTLAPTRSPDRAVAAAEPPSAPKIMAIVFADAVNFSKLGEREIPCFIEHFLGAIGDLIARSPQPPVLKNTWGDGLYLVFESVRAAGEFALALSEVASRTDWRSKGLPAELNLRIALHAGPVYQCVDPVTKQRNYVGAHVSRGARIEPITPPGQVYASEAFAALASASRVRGFVCEYAGQTLWAKGSGTFPTYHVRRRTALQPRDAP